MAGMTKIGKVVRRSGRVHILEDLQGRKFRAESAAPWAPGRWVRVIEGTIIESAGEVTPAVVVEG